MSATNDFSQKLYALWKKAIKAYTEGKKDVLTLFDSSEVAFLNSNGLFPQDISDYAEDFIKNGSPDFSVVLLIESIRRNYFLEEQKGTLSSKKLKESSFPGKSEQLGGIQGLPRVIEKARAKLHGELPSDLMYYCPLAKKVLKETEIHPAELLKAIWFYENHPDGDECLNKWILKRAGKNEDTESLETGDFCTLD